VENKPLVHHFSQENQENIPHLFVCLPQAHDSWNHSEIIEIIEIIATAECRHSALSHWPAIAHLPRCYKVGSR